MSVDIRIMLSSVRVLTLVMSDWVLGDETPAAGWLLRILAKRLTTTAQYFLNRPLALSLNLTQSTTPIIAMTNTRRIPTMSSGRVSVMYLLRAMLGLRSVGSAG